MAAYLVGEIEVTNRAGLEPYRAAVGDTITQLAVASLSGAAPRNYQKILPSRLENTIDRLFTVEGVASEG